MKKFLLVSLTLLSAFTCMSAKEIKFYLGDDAVASGATVAFEGYEVYPNGATTEYYIDPKVYIMKDAADNVSVRTTSNYDIQLCIGGQCEAAKVIDKSNLNFAANTKTDLQLECSVFLDKDAEVELPAINVLIEAWYVSDPATVYTMTLNMGDVAGAKDAVADTNTVTVSGKNLNYNIDGASNITIFNLAGRAVYRQKVEGSGVLGLDFLPVGMYLFRADGVAATTGKFIIR